MAEGMGVMRNIETRYEIEFDPHGDSHFIVTITMAHLPLKEAQELIAEVEEVLRG